MWRNWCHVTRPKPADVRRRCSKFVSSLDSRRGSPSDFRTRIVRGSPAYALSMRRERGDRMRSERNRPHGLLRLGWLELSCRCPDSRTASVPMSNIEGRATCGPTARRFSIRRGDADDHRPDTR